MSAPVVHARMVDSVSTRLMRTLATALLDLKESTAKPVRKHCEFGVRLFLFSSRGWRVQNCLVLSCTLNGCGIHTSLVKTFHSYPHPTNVQIFRYFRHAHKESMHTLEVFSESLHVQCTCRLCIQTIVHVFPCTADSENTASMNWSIAASLSFHLHNHCGIHAIDILHQLVHDKACTFVLDYYMWKHPNPDSHPCMNIIVVILRNYFIAYYVHAYMWRIWHTLWLE